MAHTGAVHDLGKIILDLALSLAIGGGRLADIAVLRDLAGHVGCGGIGPGGGKAG